MSIESIRVKLNKGSYDKHAMLGGRDDSVTEDIRYLLKQVDRLREERDSFQRVGIKVQEVNVRLVEALEQISEIDNTWDEPLPTAMRRIANEAIQAYKLLENDPLQSN